MRVLTLSKDEIDELKDRIDKIEGNVCEKIEKTCEKQDELMEKLFKVEITMARYIEKFELNAGNKKFTLEKIWYPIIIVIFTFLLTKFSDIIPKILTMKP